MKATRKNALNDWSRFILLAVLLLLLNVVSNWLYYRFDLTSEKRFSVSPPTKQLLRNLKDEVFVRVYLSGDLPAGFTRLQNSTADMLNEFRAIAGPNIRFEFIDPTAGEEERKKMVFKDLVDRGLMPTNLMTKDKSGNSQKIIFPGALVTYGGREVAVSLLENQIGFGPQEVLNHSVILLEYKLASAIRKLTQYRPSRVAFLSGHGEYPPVLTADFRQTLQSQNYEVYDFDLHSFYKIPEKFDALIIAAPEYPFSEKDKFKIDQYIMKGGKVLWLLESANASLDSLRNSPTGQFVLAKELNLDDLLFRFGVRVNADLIQDINLCNPIPLVIGMQGDAPQTELFPWYYFPLLVSDNAHPVNRNLDPVAARFCASVDTIRKDGIRKTILLRTSPNAKAQLTPTRVHFGIVTQKPNPAYYNQPDLPVAVALEGTFESLYKNRLSGQYREVADTNANLAFVEQSANNRMIVVGDGDIIRNDMRNDSSVYPLGYYPFTRQVFANKDFLLNCMEYLTDSIGLLEARNKEVKLRMLDGVKAEKDKAYWQGVNLLVPLTWIGLFALAFGFWRKRKYGKSGKA